MLTQILVIEDDDAIRLGVCDAVESAGFDAIGAADGERGLELLNNGSFDLVLLDVVLPGRDGLAILGIIREKSPTLPVIMLTARGDISDRVQGLLLGADDYVVKPFNVRELLARIDAVLRRSPGRSESPEQITLPDGQIAESEKREIVATTGERTELSEKETDLLKYLTGRQGYVVTRAELIEHVWQMNPHRVQTRTVDMHIARLREKLGEEDTPKLIVTVRGQRRS
jgi:DNA-binding response OmpR family regulator